MAAKGYCSTADVAAELGVVLTPEQATYVSTLIEQAEAYVDRYTGRAWIVTSPAAELGTVPDDGLIFVTNVPLVDVTGVEVRWPVIGAESTALVADETFEVLDPATGALLVSTGYRGYLATITYTHSNGAAAVPGDIRRATTLIVASWFAPALAAEAAAGAGLEGLAGMQSLSLGSGEIAIKFGSGDSFAASGSGNGRQAIPGTAQILLDQRRRMVFA